MRCAIYVRVSTNKEEQKSSLENQEAQFKNYIIEKGWDIHEIYVDVESGTTDKRRSFKRLIEDAENRKFDCILAKEMSRLARNGELSYMIKRVLKASKVHLITLDGAINTIEDNTDKFGLFAWLYENESYRTSERIRAALKQKALRGEYKGSNPPYGYNYNVNDKRLVIREDSSVDAVQLIFHLYLQGKGLEAIAKEMDRRGYPTPATLAGKRNCGLYWQGSSIKLILGNPHYVGNLVQGRSEVRSVTDKTRDDISEENWIVKENIHECIITREDFETVQQLMKSRYVTRPKFKKHLFTNYIYCADCGTSLWYLKNRKAYVCGRFKKHGMVACTSHSMKEESLKKLIIGEFREMSKASINKEQILKRMEAKMLKSATENQKRIKHLGLELEKLKLQNIKLVKLLANQEITTEDYRSTGDFNRTQIEQIERQIIELDGSTKHYHQQKELVNKLSVELERILNFNVIDEEILHRLIEKIEVKENEDVIIHYRFANPFTA
jgi:site-specific DNA recombinase